MLYSVLEILFRHRWRYLLLIVVLPLLGAALCVPLFPKSTATTSIWVQDQTLVNANLPVYNQYMTPAQITQGDMEQYFVTQAFQTAVARRLVATKVVADSKQATALATDLDGALTATTQGDNLLTVTYSCGTAQLCPKILGAVVATYEGYATNNQQRQVKVALQIYQQQLEQAQKQLATAQAALHDYLAQHPGESADSVSDPALTTLSSNAQSAQNAVQNAQAKLASVQSEGQAGQLSSSGLYTVMDAPHTVPGHLKNLPTKQMLLVAAALWGIAVLSLILTVRTSRVVRHPHQLEALLGVPVGAITEPLPKLPTTSGTVPRLEGAPA